MERQRRALEAGAQAGGQAEFALSSGDGRDRLAQGNAGGKVEREGDGGELALVIDSQRSGRGREVGEGTQWHLGTTGRAYVDVLQCVRTLLKIRFHLHYHMVLVQLREDGRDLTLAEGVVEGIVDHLGGDAQPRGGVAVDHQRGLQPPVLLITRHVPQLRECLQLLNQPWRPQVQLIGIGTLNAVLILRPADPVFHREVLDGLQKEGDAFHLGQLWLQATDDVAGTHLALVEWLQVNLDAPTIEGGVDAVHADK